MESPSARRRCPSFLEIARFEAGDLTDDLPRAFIHAHSRQCARCGGTVCEIRDARAELLGVTPPDQARAARGAGGEIHRRLRRQFAPGSPPPHRQH